MLSEGQGNLACCNPWGRKELNATERLNNMLRKITESCDFERVAKTPSVLHNIGRLSGEDNFSTCFFFKYSYWDGDIMTFLMCYPFAFLSWIELFNFVRLSFKMLHLTREREISLSLLLIPPGGALFCIWVSSVKIKLCNIYRYCGFVLCDKYYGKGLAGGVSYFLGSKDFRRNINAYSVSGCPLKWLFAGCYFWELT